MFGTKSQSFEKIKKCILSSQNKLHLDTCMVMIALFNLQTAGLHEPIEEQMEQELRDLLDKQSLKIGALIIN